MDKNSSFFNGTVPQAPGGGPTDVSVKGLGKGKAPKKGPGVPNKLKGSITQKDATVDSPKKCCDGKCEESVNDLFQFDKVWRQLTEADDAIGGDFNSPNANLDGEGFDDNSGDLNPIDNGENNDDGENDDYDEDDEDDEELTEDPVEALREIRDRINQILGEDDSEFLDNPRDNDTAEEGEAEDIGGETPPPPPAQPAPPAPPAQQNESWQRKTAFGPHMSDKAPGKLGKKKGGKGGKKFCVRKTATNEDAKGRKVPLSKFGPKMSDKVSRLKKGEFFQ